MTTLEAAHRAKAGPVRRFLRTPKGLLLLVLAFLALAATPIEGLGRVGPNVGTAVAVAGLLDLVILRVRRKAWVFPAGAVLSGLIVALVLSPISTWQVVAATATVAILSKYAFRLGSANVFNPAALALLVSALALGSAQSWWGSLPSLPTVAVALVLATGLFIADRINKLPMLLAFLGLYYLLFTATAFLGDPAQVGQIFRAPGLNAALFFAGFMLDDPPTSPVHYRNQVRFGLLVAVASYAAFMLLGGVYYLLAGLLVGNLWEALRRRLSRA